MFTLKKVTVLLRFALVRPVERGARFCFACFTLKIYPSGPEVHVFKGRKSFLLLRMSWDSGRKALIDKDGWVSWDSGRKVLIDEDGWDISRFFS